MAMAASLRQTCGGGAKGAYPRCAPSCPFATGVGGGSRLLDGAFEGIDERRTGINAALHGWHGPGMLGHARDGCRCAPVRVAARLGRTHRKAMEAQASRPPEPSPSPGPQPDKPTGTALCPSAKAQAGSCAALAPAPARRCCASRSDDARITGGKHGPAHPPAALLVGLSLA